MGVFLFIIVEIIRYVKPKSTLSCMIVWAESCVMSVVSLVAVHPQQRGLWRPRDQDLQPEQPLPVQRLHQRVPLRLREGQAPLLLPVVHRPGEGKVRKYNTTPAPIVSYGFVVHIFNEFSVCILPCQHLISSSSFIECNTSVVISWTMSLVLFHTCH